MNYTKKKSRKLKGYFKEGKLKCNKLKCKTKKNIRSYKRKRWNGIVRKIIKRRSTSRLHTNIHYGGVRGVPSSLKNSSIKAAVGHATPTSSISKHEIPRHSSSSLLSSSLSSHMPKCMYDPFCYQTNPDHIKKFHHTSIDDLINKLNEERSNGDDTFFNYIIRQTEEILRSKNDLPPKQIDKLYKIHIRLQEDGFPNMNVFSQIIDKKNNLS